MTKTKFSLEFDMQGVSSQLLWQYIAMPRQLELWFADEVTQVGKAFTFAWDDTRQEAALLSVQTESYVRFHWKEDGKERTFFEMRILVSEFSGRKALLVTDFADSPDDVDEMSKFWNQVVARLQRKLGCA